MLNRYLITFMLLLWVGHLGASSTPNINGIIDSALRDLIEEQYQTTFKYIESPSKHPKLIIETVQKSVRSYGYFNAKVSFESDNNIINIELNQPTTIQHIQIHNQESTPELDQALLSLLQSLSMHQVLSTEHMNDWVNELQSALLKRGYFDHQFRLSYSITGPQSAQLNLNLQPGSIYHLGPIVINGQGINHDFIIESLSVKMGDTLDENTLNIIKQDLWATHLFKQIQVSLTPNHVTKIIEVTINYDPIERIAYDVGVGVMDDALMAKCNISFPRINHWGHQLHLKNQIQFADADLDKVLLDAQLIYSIIHQNQSTNIYFNTHLDHSGSLAHLLTHQLKLEHQYHINDQIQILGGANIASVLTEPLATKIKYTSFLVTPFIQASIHSIVHEDYLHLKAQAKALFSSKNLGSDHDFGVLDLSGETSTQWGLQWLTRWHISKIMYYKDFSSLPANIKLSTGGADLIRGYDYQSIGFGDKLFEASVEARYLMKSFYISAFFDVGMADMEWSTTPKQSSGFGMGYDFGETSIGLDIAYPEHNRNNAKLHLNYYVHF